MASSEQVALLCKMPCERQPAEEEAAEIPSVFGKRARSERASILARGQSRLPAVPTLLGGRVAAARVSSAISRHRARSMTQ